MLFESTLDFLDCEGKGFPFDDASLEAVDSISSLCHSDPRDNFNADEYLSERCLQSEQPPRTLKLESKILSVPDPNRLPTVVLPSGESVKILGTLPTGIELEMMNLKRKREECFHEEERKAAKRMRNRVLAQQSRERKKKYVETLEKEKSDMRNEIDRLTKENESLRTSSLLYSKRAVVLYMLLCVAFLVVSQQVDEIPSRVSAIELPSDFPNTLTHMDVLLEQYTHHRLDLERGLSRMLPNSIIHGVRDLPSNFMESPVKVEEEVITVVLKRLVHETLQAFKRRPTNDVTKDLVIRRDGSSKDNPVTLLNFTNCESEDSDEENSSSVPFETSLNMNSGIIGDLYM